MKSTLKVIAAALALAAAGVASAQVNIVTTPVTGSDVIFYAFDLGTGNSFSLDLSNTYSNFLPASAAAGTSFTDNLSGNAAWNQYIAAEGANFSSTTWGVTAAANSLTAYGVITTVTAGSTVNTSNAGNIRGSTSPFNFYTNGLNLLSINPANGYFAPAVDVGSDNATVSIKNTLGLLTKFTTDNALGVSANFDYFNVAASAVASVKTIVTPTVYGNGASQFNFDGSTLSYTVAAVPEPSSYLMMLAGLLMVGGLIARRRDSK